MNHKAQLDTLYKTLESDLISNGYKGQYVLLWKKQGSDKCISRAIIEESPLEMAEYFKRNCTIPKNGDDITIHFFVKRIGMTDWGDKYGLVGLRPSEYA